MPKKKRPELSKDEQLKRFLEVAKERDVDADDAEREFMAILPEQAAQRSSRKSDK